MAAGTIPGGPDFRAPATAKTAHCALPAPPWRAVPYNPLMPGGIGLPLCGGGGIVGLLVCRSCAGCHRAVLCLLVPQNPGDLNHELDDQRSSSRRYPALREYVVSKLETHSAPL